MAHLSDMENGEISRQDFDGAGYLESYPDVGLLGMDPFEHYNKIGRHLSRSPGRRPHESASAGKPATRTAAFRSFGTILHNPLISILVVSFNSGKDLDTLFRSIVAQTYTNYEIILIENGAEDTEPLLRTYFPDGHFERADNIGFAEANNLALRRAKGEMIAPINPDTRLHTDMLRTLLDSLRFDETAAVAVPKIYFATRFIHLRIASSCPFSIRKDEILEGLTYRKLFICDGMDQGESIRSSEAGVLALNIPYEDARSVEISVTGDEIITSLETQLGFGTVRQKILDQSTDQTVRLDFDTEVSCNARYLVNNAGSALNPDGSPFDRGFGQFDDGAYYSKTYVNALCGCAALIRRSAIVDRDLFFGAMFAYYEDSELSHWLTSSGYRILYQPASKIYHRHSESTDENSPSWNVLVGRSRQLYDRVTQDRNADLSDFRFSYPEEFRGALRSKLEAFDADIRESGRFSTSVTPHRPTACVYNSYFRSMGGGEKHVLDIAEVLSKEYDVYLVCESDFDIATLESYFSLDLSRVRKLIVNNVDTYFTSKFDLFVNSTFLSRIVPAAKENMYIVSFPQVEIKAEMNNRYHFVHNSPFTRRWAEKYWGPHKNSTVLPIIGNYDTSKSAAVGGKKKEIISVGRFTYDGHCKNHHLVAKAFRDLVKSGEISSEWSLNLLGSCEVSLSSAVKYHDDLVVLSEGFNIKVSPNVDRGYLDEAYSAAAVYVHAAGLGIPEDQPNRHEHFGITVFEAIANGCIPVVYHRGGPAEQVVGLSGSEVYADFEGLKAAILRAVRTFDGQGDIGRQIAAHATAMRNINADVVREVFMSSQEVDDREQGVVPVR